MPVDEQSKISHVSLHTHRLHPDADNPREVAFAEQWIKEHSYTDLLQQLMIVYSKEPKEGYDPDWRGIFGKQYVKAAFEINQRDATIVATVIQWLGSNVGMSFLEESLKRCGYRIERVKDAEK